MPPGAMADPCHDFNMTGVDFLDNYVGDGPLRWGHCFSRTGVSGEPVIRSGGGWFLTRKN
jgi:hypothetical protein